MNTTLPKVLALLSVALFALGGTAPARATDPLLYQARGTGDAPAPEALSWLQQKIWPEDSATRDYFATSFAMSGDTAVGGSPYASGSAGSYQGAAYVFSRVGGNWAQAQKLVAPDASEGANFGNAVALDGNTVMVSATSAGNGAVYVFTRGTDGAWSAAQELVASDAAAQSGSAFGGQIVLKGDLALIGAASAVADNVAKGKVYVFRRGTDGQWSETQQLSAADGIDYSYFGASLAYENGLALIGAPGTTVNGEDSYGVVYAFAQAGGTFTQIQRFTISDGAAYQPFGGAVAISGSRALVAAVAATVNGVAYAGAVYVFEYAQDSGWTQTQKLSAGDANDYMAFGSSVTLLGPTAVIGATGAEVDGNINQGAVYVFTETGGVWTQTSKLVASDGEPANYFGWAVSFDGITLASAANSAGIDDLSQRGAAYLYARVGGDSHTVTPGVAEGAGSINPAVPQTVADTATTSFTFTPGSGYRLDHVGGTCTGTLNGNTYTTAPIDADCSVLAYFDEIAKTVTPSVSGGHGAISPDQPQVVDYGDTVTFTLIPDPDYTSAEVGGTCGGTLTGNTFTTAPITGNCTVVATFRAAQHTVTPSVAGGHGGIDPDQPQSVADGANIAFTLLPDAGYVPTVGGSCNGTLQGNVYTTAPVIADCSVEVSYALAVYTVTPVLLTDHGIISPGLPRTAGYGSVLTFVVAPDPGFVASIGGSCGGTLDGNTYATAPLVADCTVEASFGPDPADVIFANGFD